MATFDIFCGTYGSDDTIWRDAVEGLEEAELRMKQLAVERPGAYFVFSPLTANVVASTETSRTPTAATKANDCS